MAIERTTNCDESCSSQFGMSHHEAGRRFGIDRRTVKKMLSYSAPPGYRRTKPVRRPKLDGFTGIVDAILEADTDPDVPRKQRHTAHRIFERLRDEHGFTGGYTIVKDYVRARRQSTREAFVPLHHPPGHAQVDFGEAVVEVGGQREKVAFFCLILPHSDVWFVKAYPRETTEAFLDGHVSAFAFLGGVPRSVLYDNTTLAVARILGDGTRRRTQAFTHLQSHYLFRDRFGRPDKGNDRGKVEALVKTARRRFMVPIPKVHDLSVLNERLLARCLERLDTLEGRRLGGGVARRSRRPARSARRPLRGLRGMCRARSRPRPWCATGWRRARSLLRHATGILRDRLDGRGWEIPPLPWTNLSPPFSHHKNRTRRGLQYPRSRSRRSGQDDLILRLRSALERSVPDQGPSRGLPVLPLREQLLALLSCKVA